MWLPPVVPTRSIGSLPVTLIRELGWPKFLKYWLRQDDGIIYEQIIARADLFTQGCELNSTFCARAL